MVLTTSWEKVRNTQKPCPGPLTQKFIRYYTFLVVVEDKETEYKTESTALSEQREATCHEEKESKHRP